MKSYFKIFHKPSGEFVSDYELWEIKPSHYEFRRSREGRLWHRKADVLTAWQTMTARCREILGKITYMQEFEVHELELTTKKIFTLDEIKSNLETKNKKYEINKLKSEINSAEWNLKYYKDNSINEKNKISELETKLAKLKKKLISEL